MKKTGLHLLFFLGAVLTPAYAEVISLVAPATTTGPFDVTVRLTNVFDVHDPVLDGFVGYGFNVTYDPGVFLLTGETPGAYFDDFSGIPGAQVAGLVSAPWFFLGPLDFTEPLILATLHFDVVGSGSSTIAIAGDPNVDLNQGLIYLSGADALSASAEVGAVPEPGSLLLFAGGLLALGLLFSSRKQSGRTAPPTPSR